MSPSRKMFYFVFAFFFVWAQLLSGCWAGLDYVQSFPGGEFAVCEPCKLGRGKCRRVCLEHEKPDGYCKLNFICCRQTISATI